MSQNETLLKIKMCHQPTWLEIHNTKKTVNLETKREWWETLVHELAPKLYLTKVRDSFLGAVYCGLKSHVLSMRKHSFLPAHQKWHSLTLRTSVVTIETPVCQDVALAYAWWDKDFGLERKMEATINYGHCFGAGLALQTEGKRRHQMEEMGREWY